MSVILQEINSSIAKLRALLAEAKADLQRIQSLQNGLCDTLHGLWEASELSQLAQSEKYWRELVLLVTSGKILSVTAQADGAMGSGANVHVKKWIGNGHDYAKWLGRGIATIIVNQKTSTSAAADLLGKSFSLGYTDDIVAQIISSMLLQNPSHLTQCQSLAAHLARFQQRQFLNSILNMSEKQFFPLQSINYEVTDLTLKEKNFISGSIALLQTFVSTETTGYKEYLVSWLVRSPAVSVNLIRAVIAALPSEEQENVLQKCWEQFGDKLNVRHAPVIQQEATAQTVLIAAGYVHRRSPRRVSLIARSSTHSAGISERIASSSPKARFLGMVVGTVISSLIDKEGARMDFDVPVMNTPEALWYQSLVHVHDRIGTIKDLHASPSKQSLFKPLVDTQPPRAKIVKIAESKSRIIEVLEDDDEDDDGLTPYAKPDSDPENSDDDATNVQRNKPTAPVYIRDLLTNLQNTESYDIHNLALTTAAPLIRRKANFGSELLDQLEPLASTLLSLQDTFDTPSFHDLRLQALIALLVAQPSRMGPWFAQTYFSGDYSLSQRAMVLSTLGLGARELAGYSDDNNETQDEERFPSKRLPDKLHKRYAESSEIDLLARRLESTMLSSISTKQRAGRKIVKNDLAKVVADSFFFPLTGRFAQAATSATAQTHLSPHLLPLYLKTLAFILTAAGPSTLALPSMTVEFWTLLLSLRSHVLRTSSSSLAKSGGDTPLNILTNAASTASAKTSNSATLEALLFALLSLLTLNTSSTNLTRQLAMGHAAELLETQSWVQMVFEATRGGEVEGDRVRTLAAGILVCVEEVVEAWRGTVMGGVGRAM